MRTGISLEPPVEGLVGEFEEREAARFGLVAWRQWVRLPYRERVAGVAHYRLFHLIEAHSADAIDQELKTRTRR